MVLRFLNDPIPLRHQIRVRMPTFHFADGEAESIADYFAVKAAQERPAHYTRRLRLALGLEPKIERDGAPGYTQALSWPQRALYGEGQGISAEDLAERVDVSADVVRAIERGSKPETAASFHKIRAYGDEVGFAMPRPVDSSYEMVERRTPRYLAARAEELPGGMHPAALGARSPCAGPTATSATAGGQAARPRDADRVGPRPRPAHERLREDWVLRVAEGAEPVYPGTSMPANFAGDPPAVPGHLPRLRQCPADPGRHGLALQLRPHAAGRRAVGRRALESRPGRATALPAAIIPQAIQPRNSTHEDSRPSESRPRRGPGPRAASVPP